MPGKSQRGKGKQTVRSKRKRSVHSSGATAAQLPVSQTHEPVPKSEISAPLPSKSTPLATVSSVRYPYIITEMRRIGILAGITLVILVVLALVLS